LFDEYFLCDMQWIVHARRRARRQLLYWLPISVSLVLGLFRIPGVIAHTLTRLGVRVELTVVPLAVGLALVVLHSNTVTSRILCKPCVFAEDPRIFNVWMALKLAERMCAALASCGVAYLRLCERSALFAAESVHG